MSSSSTPSSSKSPTAAPVPRPSASAASPMLRRIHSPLSEREKSLLSPGMLLKKISARPSLSKSAAITVLTREGDAMSAVATSSNVPSSFCSHKRCSACQLPAATSSRPSSFASNTATPRPLCLGSRIPATSATSEKVPSPFDLNKKFDASRPALISLLAKMSMPGVPATKRADASARPPVVRATPASLATSRTVRSPADERSPWYRRIGPP
mmetsp:Transcript_6464/g.26298  ORF Transcript_6464/g.26298 Transcript_6464/m.26298 type:complete len:212 (+) Transcript_6464:3883-4518(+)